MMRGTPLVAFLVAFAATFVVTGFAQAPWTVRSEQPPRESVISMGWLVSAEPFRTTGARYTFRAPVVKNDGSRWPLLDVGREVAVIVGGHGLNARVVSRCVAAAPVNCTPYPPRAEQSEGDTRYVLEAPPELPVLVEAIVDMPKPAAWWEYGTPPPPGQE